MKTLYVASCCLFLVAIACDLIAKRYASNALRVAAASMTHSQSDRTQADREATATARVSDCFGLAGFVMIVPAGLFWLGSVIVGKQQGKRLTPVISSLLLATYVAMFLIMV